MDKTKQEKIKRFMADKVMSGAVMELLTESFLSPKGARDIHIIAAERIAIDLLKEGFRNMERISQIEDRSENKLIQPAL